MQISAPGLGQRIGDTLEFKIFFCRGQGAENLHVDLGFTIDLGLWNGFLGFSTYYIFGGVQIYYNITKHHKYNIFPV